MLESCTSEQAVFPPAELLYNEGWLLRIIIDWFSTHSVQNHPINYPENGKWYSEALLPSAFLPRSRKDKLAESWTHADAVIGHFKIGNGGKANLTLLPDATHFAVIEAKIFSKLSAGVTHAAYYNQAARTVACIAEVLKRGARNPGEMSFLGFFLIAPKSKIVEGIFAEHMTRESIGDTVERRVNEYGGVHKKWLSDWFVPALDKIDIRIISWEELIETIRENDSQAGREISEFYKQCKYFNDSAGVIRPDENDANWLKETRKIKTSKPINSSRIKK